MAMRLSGLISGMDTENVVAQLMKAQRLKTTKLQNKITTTEWKKDKWSALNSKIYSFYTGQLSKMRMQGSFAVKKATSSNINKVDVSAGTNAPEGSHLIKVKQLASSQFVTGELSGANKDGKDVNGNSITTSTKLKDLGLDPTNGTSIHIEAAGKKINLDVRDSTTVGDFVNALKSAGLNANYDTTHKRFFISSKASGADNAFTIETSSSNIVQEKNAIRDSLGYDSLGSVDKKKIDDYLNNYLNVTNTDGDREVIKTKLLEIKHQKVRTEAINDYKTDQANIDRVTAELEIELSKDLAEGETLDEKVLQAAVKDKLNQEAEAKVNAEYVAWEENTADEYNVFSIAEIELDSDLEGFTGISEVVTSESGKLSALGLSDIVKNETTGVIEISETSQVKLVQATDAIVIYNGAELTGSSNNFSVNGLNLTLKGVTTEDEVINLSVSGNTQAVYDTVKDFVKTYNELLKEMNDGYNAESARGYDPLTEEEKATMTDDQIKKWEDKIKDSLLKRDDTLSGLISSFRNTMGEGVKVNGKTYSLASFGIASRNYSEKGILYINGDADDAAVASLDNKLMEALTNNPDDVMAVLNKLGDNLYNSLMDKMKSTTLRSALTVYNDKEMTKSLTNYKSDLDKLEAKLLDVENRYYKQFSAMETAMAKMNAQSASLMSMLGMNNQNQ